MGVIKAESPASRDLAGRRPSILDARAAIQDFLRDSLADVHRVDITKIVRCEGPEGGWEAEAEVWQPNATIQTLGLKTQHLVLDSRVCLIRLDDQLNVVGYEIKEME